jgi:hypothetical protein
MRSRLVQPWLAVAAFAVPGAAAVGWLDATGGSSDVSLFADAGSTMLSGNWLHAYHASAVQAGPLELALCSLARTLGGGAQAGWAIVLDLVCTAVMITGAATLLERRPARLLTFAVGAYVLWLPGQGYLGHPAELIVAVLWLFAARASSRGRPTVAGALVGLSACFELWGVLGVSVLALAPRLRRCGPGLALAGFVPVVALLPFALGGDFHMFDLTWKTTDGVPRLLFGPGYPFTWPLRVAEGAIVTAAGVAAARLARRSTDGIWIVPAVAALCRIALDPVDYGYYWDTVLVIGLVGAVQLIARRREVASRLGAMRAAVGYTSSARRQCVSLPAIGDHTWQKQEPESRSRLRARSAGAATTRR